MDPKVQFDFFDTYIATVQNSVGSKMFKQCFAFVNGAKKDIAENGVLSCALFVSSILVMFGLLKSRHATVEGALKYMQKNGWYKIKKPRAGAVLVWEASAESSSHKHIGFYISKNFAISNSSNKNVPTRHHWTFGKNNINAKRRINSIWWNDKLKIS